MSTTPNPPPPPGQPTQESRQLSATQQTVYRNEMANLKKLAPKYIKGEQSWDLYMDRFMLETSDYNLLTDTDIKKVLYSRLIGEAYEMASPQFNPTNDTYKNMEVKAYATALGNLFEPASESGQAKIVFEQRKQIAGEHPTVYYQHKLGLFMKAYKAEHRDFEYFYGKVIIGLINQEMRNYLRMLIPEDLTNTQKFREKIVSVATMVRRKYLDGEISESDALGAEAFSIPSQYANKIETSLGQKNFTINAMTGMKPRTCYHCKSKEHFIAQCPRKAAGLPATVQALSSDQTNPKRVTFEGTSNPFNGNQKYKNMKKKNQSKFQQKGKTGRIMFVYEDDNGELQCEQVSEDIEEEEPETEQNASDTHGINIVEDNEYQGYTESDYVPGVFLGQAH